MATRVERRVEPDPVAAGSGSSCAAVLLRNRGPRCNRSVLRLLDRDTGLGRALDGLEHHAIFVGKFGELIELGNIRIGVDVEGEADLLEADGDVGGYPKRAAEVDVALGADIDRSEGNA